MSENTDEQYNESALLLQERISQLELALEDRDWYRLSGQTELEFSQQGLMLIRDMSRIMYLKNPLIQRGVNVQRDYVFGQGVTIEAEDAGVQGVISEFLEDEKNRSELTSHQGMTYKEVDLSIEGNLFFVFFVDPLTGRVQVRSIPTDEMLEILCDPEDAKSPWYYKRQRNVVNVDLISGVESISTVTSYYPDWNYYDETRPVGIGSYPIQWNSPVYHIKVGGLSHMKFGVPEVYAALDWAKAYKEFLEDWATLTRAYSRFAWQITTTGGKKGISAAKTKFHSGLTPVSSTETNPPPTTGAMFIAGEGTSLSPVRTSGAQVSAEDGRRIMLMVAATFGLPESFFGDVSVGTLATAKSLDRPTELKFSSRQTLWKDILGQILAFVIYQAVKFGTLAGKVIDEKEWSTKTEVNGERPKVQINFPPILEHDITASVGAIVSAATLSGSAPANTIDTENVTRMLLTALGEEDMVQDVLDALETEEKERAAKAEKIAKQMTKVPVPVSGKDGSTSDEPVPSEPTTPAQEAIREIRNALTAIKESYASRSA